MGQIGEKCIQVFGEELSYLKDPKFKEFVIRCYDAVVPESFFERPASNSGKYHPELSSGPGGLVRHTKYAVWWAIQLERALDTTDGKGEGDHRDIVVASLILHDGLKDGDPFKAGQPERQGFPGGKLICGVHGIDMAEAIWTRVLKYKLEWPEQTLIMCAIAGHMGVWTIGERYRPNNVPNGLARKIAQIVHICDMCAAQKVEVALRGIGAQMRAEAQPA